MPLDEALERLRWAADVIPRVSKLNGAAAREYLDQVGREPEDEENDEDEPAPDEDEVQPESSNAPVFFNGVLPPHFTAGIRAFKPPARERGYYAGILTYLMRTSSTRPATDVDWFPRCRGGAKNLAQLQSETVPSEWNAPSPPTAEYDDTDMLPILRHAGASADLLSYVLFTKEPKFLLRILKRFLLLLEKVGI